ncbi:MAG: N-acetylmuramoyl-L-alanine amidase [Eubacteriales bacterium]|nr:N-acetylmuramoyl-L-alanine amidase [Eubacteriales bacterium]
MKKYISELFMACLLLICFFFLSRQAAEVSNNLNDKKVQDNVIVLDAGHGGIDPGMLGIGGLEEKKINLEVALRLQQLLESKGFTVVMTRSEDKGLYDESSNSKKSQDMQRRIALINESKPVLTVSIHQNSYQDSSVKGPQVFYFQHSAEGEKLARALQESLNTGLAVERPRKEKANTTYYLLKRSEGTLVIAECGFLTNPDEAALLQTEEYQEKVAAALAEGILTYLEEEGKYKKV